ncbi:hypothetical protein [Flavobacterium luteolum]|uniref:hypothetical protein n=1 Tax=Flavobacterium luteolum TaxID=3003259 RepID=UPI00248E5340|nr:hypothetical protein [Flavobacterium luteolum]
MIQEILTYKKIVSEIDELINKSPYKKNYIIDKIGIAGPTFYRKLKTNSFTPDEMLEIAKILSPEEHYMMELTASIEEGKRDIVEGRVITHEEMLEEIKRKRDK